MKFERTYTLDLRIIEPALNNIDSFEEMARHATHGIVMKEFIKQVNAGVLPSQINDIKDPDYVEYHKQTNEGLKQLVPYMHEEDGLKVNPEIFECGIKFAIKSRFRNMPHTFKWDRETMTVSISEDTDNWEFGRQTI